jgi:LytS/YehU family sensor histidine kinase
VSRYYSHYLSSELRAERLERQFFEARLNALRMQLDPHFLFNTLNAISAQVHRDPTLARTMIEHLGDLLRSSLDSRERHEIPLVEELAFLEHYLAIQRVRFGKHLQVDTQIETDVRFAAVPSLLLQPLVENAIRHGLSRRASGGTVVITAGRERNQLVLRVLDDGVGLPSGWTLDGSAGIGLSVTRDRLSSLHPDRATLTVRARPEGGTEVQVRLPLAVVDTRSAHEQLAV